MWTPAARQLHDTIRRDYPSSLSDAEWALICPSFAAFMATWDMRRIVDAILYRVKYAVPWRALPVNFPPWQTVYWHFRRFVAAGLWERLNFDMVVKDRERCGREAQPTAAIADSQTVKATESRAERAYDGGKKITGLKRHTMTDTDGRMLAMGLSRADMHDSRGGAILLRASRQLWPFILRLWADSAYRGDHMGSALPGVTVEVVTGPKNQVGFIVQKRRWVVERTFGWFGRFRLLWRVCDDRHDVLTSTVYLAHAMLLTRRIANAQR